MEETPLLRMGMRLRRRQNQIEQGVVGYFRRKAVLSSTQAEHHDVVRLKPLRAMHGHVCQFEFGMPLSQLGHVLRTRVPVTAQQQHCRFFTMIGGVRANHVQRLPQERQVFGLKTHMHARSVRSACGAHLLADLRGVAKNELGRDLCDTIGAAEGGFQISLLCVPEVISELAHDGDVGPGKLVYRLPIVADGK